MPLRTISWNGESDYQTDAHNPQAEFITGVSVVVPVYNSQSTLETLVQRLATILPKVAESYEVILVNDGSRDASWQVITKLSEQFSWVRGICMMRNFGQHNAILCGVRSARCSTIVTMDDDLQHPPEEVPKLIAKLREGYDVVYGTPNERKHSWWRNLTSRFTKGAFAVATGNKSIKNINAFRAFRSHLRYAFQNFRSPNLQIDVLLSWGTNQFATVPVRHEPRAVGKSNYSIQKLLNHTMLLLTGYSTAPLRLASLVGFAFTLIGMLVLVYVVVRYMFEASTPGFPFLAAVISIFSGIQLFILGIIGEYIARMFNRSLERPTYVTSQTVGQNELGHATEELQKAA